jgi:hypothetical protein
MWIRRRHRPERELRTRGGAYLGRTDTGDSAALTPTPCSVDDAPNVEPNVSAEPMELRVWLSAIQAIQTTSAAPAGDGEISCAGIRPARRAIDDSINGFAKALQGESRTVAFALPFAA